MNDNYCENFVCCKWATCAFIDIGCSECGCYCICDDCCTKDCPDRGSFTYPDE